LRTGEPRSPQLKDGESIASGGWWKWGITLADGTGVGRTADNAPDWPLLQDLAKGTEIVVLDTNACPVEDRRCSTGGYYTAVLNDQGELVKVAGSKEAFSEVNSLSRKELTAVVLDERIARNDPFCKRRLERLGPRFAHPGIGCP
jgi:hypothetical protein